MKKEEEEEEEEKSLFSIAIPTTPALGKREGGRISLHPPSLPKIVNSPPSARCWLAAAPATFCPIKF